MRDKIILVGGGGHALSLLEAIPDRSRVGGYLDLKPVEGMDIPYLGDDSRALEYMEQGARFHIAFVYNGMPEMAGRRRLIERFYMDANLASIIAPTAIITPHAKIEEGAAVLNGAIVNRATICKNAIINSGAIIEHDCLVGENTFIGPGAVVGGHTTIGRDCFIGLGARLKNGIKIAPGTTIGMGTVVTNDIHEAGIYHGFPLRKHN